MEDDDLEASQKPTKKPSRSEEERRRAEEVLAVRKKSSLASKSSSSSKKQVTVDEAEAFTKIKKYMKVDEVESAKKSRSFSFRLSKSGKSKNADAEVDESVQEDDPVIELFRSRTTQRVRFQLEGQEKAPRPKERRESPEKAASSTPGSPLNIKKFMKGALFGGSKSGKKEQDEFEAAVAKEIALAKTDSEMIWASAETPSGSEVIHTKSPKKKSKSGTALTVSFAENQQIRANVIKLLNKARRAQFVHFRYEYAVKCYVKALDMLTEAKYPDEHPTVVKTLQSLNNAHHALSSYKNSANIVKMGIKYEDQGELVRALKMYTIAYRIRRDNLSKSHPSLVVLLNMLGSIQIKRGELEEAMQIYELALQDAPSGTDGDDNSGSQQEEVRPPSSTNLLAQSVTYREMGTIYEKWGETDDALRMYHLSLDSVAEYKGLKMAKEKVAKVPNAERSTSPSGTAQLKTRVDLEEVQYSKSLTSRDDKLNGDDAGMELFIGEKSGRRVKSPVSMTSSTYDTFFPPSLDERNRKKSKDRKSSDEKKGDYTDVDVALTLHQIAQLHRSEGEHNMALSAYNVALRGMKYALGKNHPNVAAILGNIGNLQKEMGDMDSAFETYQQVLGIESYRLGLSHPDVAITLHNIATIDAARGNHDHALALYKQVITLQRKVFGEDHVSVAVTSACMGDVYERLGDLKSATECFEEAVRVKTSALGRHSLEVARLLHKLGKLSLAKSDFHLADSYISRCILIYRLNKLAEDDEWVVDAYRDAADVDAAIAMGRGSQFEC